MRRTKIVCTIGPASDGAEMLEKLIREHTKPVSQEELRKQQRRRLEKEFKKIGLELPPEEE